MSLVKGKNIDTSKVFSTPRTLDNGAKLVYVNYDGGRFSIQTPDEYALEDGFAILMVNILNIVLTYHSREWMRTQNFRASMINSRNKNRRLLMLDLKIVLLGLRSRLSLVMVLKRSSIQLLRNLVIRKLVSLMDVGLRA